MSAATATGSESRFRFGEFEVDCAQWLLRKSGVRVKLQRKRFQILCVLLQRRGELVTRKELARLLWPDLHVEYERSLNTAVNCLRQALEDTSKSCRCIETCPGLGYRFVAPVEVLENRDEAAKIPQQQPPKSPSDTAEVDYRKGRFFYSKMTPESLARAGVFFESAVAADALFAPAHAGLADLKCLLGFWSLLPSPEAGEKASFHAQRALAADPRSPEAHAANAGAQWLLRRPWAQVEVAYQRALALDPCCATAHLWYAGLLSASGRHREAGEHLVTAQRSDPLSLLLNYQHAWALYARRDYRAALEQSWNALMLDSFFAPAQYTLGLAYEQLGKLEDAITEFENAKSCSDGHPATLAALAHALFKAGAPDAAELATAELMEFGKNSYCSPYWLAIAAAGRGDHESALAEIEKAGRAGDCLIDWLGVEPRFDALRSSPRFQKWLRIG